MTMDSNFGSPSIYYAAERAPLEHESKEEHRISRVLGKYHSNLRETVQRSFKQWNQAIREALRSETALKFVSAGERQSIPVKIRDGLPIPFRKIVREYDDIWWELYLNRKRLEKTLNGLVFLKDNYERIVQFDPKYSEVARDAEISSTIELVKRLVDLKRPEEMDEKDDLIDKIKRIRQDILGAYFFKIPEIHIYWMVIGILANLFGISVEGLTFVVLAHELSHAYSHRGLDIDGDMWETEAFARSDIHMIEGLAQFYTSQVCDRFKERFPSGKAAFEQLLEIQPEPYTDFNNWFDGGRKTGEPVRYSMIQARKHHIREYSQFCNVLKTAKIEIRERPRQNSIW